MRVSWRGALGLVLSLALLYWALHDIQWAEARRYLATSNALLWAASIVVSQTIFLLRARRWRPILDSVSPNIPFSPLWRATAIGMMANNVLPGRMGEVVRAVVLTREVPSVPLTSSFASLVVDRVLDAVVVMSLLAIAMLSPGFGVASAADRNIVNAGLVITISIAVVAFSVLIFAVRAPARVEAMVGWVSHRIAPRFEMRMRAMVHAFVAGLGVLRDGRRFAIVLALTIAHWLVNAVAFWLGFLAIGIDAPFTAALFVQGVIVIGVAPPQLPGFIGGFEAFARLGLAPYGVDPAHAVAWAITFHVLSLIPITLIGVWYVARLGISWSDLRRRPPDTGTR